MKTVQTIQFDFLWFDSHMGASETPHHRLIMRWSDVHLNCRCHAKKAKWSLLWREKVWRRLPAWQVEMNGCLMVRSRIIQMITTLKNHVKSFTKVLSTSNKYSTDWVVHRSGGRVLVSLPEDYSHIIAHSNGEKNIVVIVWLEIKVR